MKERDQLLKDNARLREENKRNAKAQKRRRKVQALKPFQAELIKLQRHLEATNTPMIVLCEGRDASGKGGTIRRVIRHMNEKHYRVVALAKPTVTQLSQWYYQRYVEQFPRGGEIILFNSSWYNRAMVEPVLGFCSEEEHKLFMAGVVGFEKDIIRQGSILLKLYFSVTKDKQKARYDRRKNDQLRQWKLSEVDLQAQDKWDSFTMMKYKMLRKTHTSNAPWTIIRSDNKHLARLNALKVILNSVCYEGRNLDLDFKTDPDVIVSGSRELEMMEMQRIEQGKFTH